MKQRRPGQIKIFYAPCYSKTGKHVWSMMCRWCLCHRVARDWESAMIAATWHLDKCKPAYCTWKLND